MPGRFRARESFSASFVQATGELSPVAQRTQILTTTSGLFRGGGGSGINSVSICKKRFDTPSKSQTVSSFPAIRMWMFKYAPSILQVCPRLGYNNSTSRSGTCTVYLIVLKDCGGLCWTGTRACSRTRVPVWLPHLPGLCSTLFVCFWFTTQFGTEYQNGSIFLSPGNLSTVFTFFPVNLLNMFKYVSCTCTLRMLKVMVERQ